jgi:hypothetical protein
MASDGVSEAKDTTAEVAVIEHAIFVLLRAVIALLNLLLWLFAVLLPAGFVLWLFIRSVLVVFGGLRLSHLHLSDVDKDSIAFETLFPAGLIAGRLTALAVFNRARLRATRSQAQTDTPVGRPSQS